MVGSLVEGLELLVNTLLRGASKQGYPGLKRPGSFLSKWKRKKSIVGSISHYLSNLMALVGAWTMKRQVVSWYQ